MRSSKSGSLLALLWAGTTLATPLLDSLFGRDTSDSACPSTYTSRNGLNFTSSCNQNNPFNDALAPFEADSMQDCMEHCSRFWGDHEGCFGVVWRQGDGNCWMRNSTTSELSNGKTVYTKTPVDEDGIHSALVDLTQMQPLDTDCPAEDLSRHTLSGISGVEYTVQCNKDIGGDYDTCWQGYPSCNPNPFQAFYHAKSLEECLGYCMDEHPLCRGVVWVPDLEGGYANCWPKTGFGNPVPASGTLLKITHSATLTTIDTPDTECSKNETYTPTDDSAKNFAIHCGQTNQGTNMTTLHTSNFTSCMDACASNKDGCVGAVYDSSLRGGYQNCYLQNTSSIFTDVGSSSYGVLSNAKPASSSTPSSGSGSDSSGSSSGSSSSSKAWIAGAVIGPLAGLALLFGAFILFRRRRNANAAAAPTVQEADGTSKQNPYADTNSPAPAYAPVPQYSPPVRSELGSGEGHQMNEMEGVSAAKYASQAGQGRGRGQVYEMQ